VIDYAGYFCLRAGHRADQGARPHAGLPDGVRDLQSGKELLLAGDVAWHMDAVRLNRVKDAPWIKEPAELMAAELDWLNGLSRNENNLSIVISHDDEQRRDYIARGILGDGFE